MESNKFGTAPVFFTAISTILGAVLFLRFGFAVGTLGFFGTVMIILIGHAVTIPTALAIAEIATNQKVEGGGEYFIISRSFGLVIGATIGVALYLSQAISVAFYIIAFAASFNSLIGYIDTNYTLPSAVSWIMHQSQTIGIPALILLTVIVLTKGAELGVKALYTVVFTLALSLGAFFLGSTSYAAENSVNFFSGTGNLSFFGVFAIIFPAFTGMTAGVGLSGDLKDPGRSIPMGTILGTLCGMIVYVFIAYKLAISASPKDLENVDHLVMSDIALQGSWIIPIGLAAATISSALGSLMVAPRTLQAIAKDHILPLSFANKWLADGKGKNSEPFNASLITILIAGAFILLGALDAVAEIISMFFMVTYGSLCLISFLQHFAADPSYRPRFKSRWYISLFGALACLGLMFFMNPGYATMAMIGIFALYLVISFYNKDTKNMAIIFQGVIYQLSRKIHIFLQKSEKEVSSSWRPSTICVTSNSFKRLDAFEMMKWLSYRYGFGTYIHHIEGYLSKETVEEAEKCRQRLLKMTDVSHSEIYIDTIISPSATGTVAAICQMPAVSGTRNNLLLFEFSRANPNNLEDILDNFPLMKAAHFDVALLSSTERNYGIKNEIHIWLTTSDYINANLMILIAYVIMGNSEWSDSKIKLYSVLPKGNVEAEKEKFANLIEAGQLPIAQKNIEFIAKSEVKDLKVIIRDYSRDADLTIIGFRKEAVKHIGTEVFSGYEGMGNILFVNSDNAKEIK